jgi:hypothetical protein
MGERNFSPGVKRQRREVYDSPPSSTDVKSTLVILLRPLYTLMAWSETPSLCHLFITQKDAMFHVILVATDGRLLAATDITVPLSVTMQASVGRRVREVLCYKRADRKRQTIFIR